MHACEDLSCRFYDECFHAADGHEKEDDCEGIPGACVPCRPIEHPIKAGIIQEEHESGLTLVIERDRGRGSSRSVSAMSFLSEEELKEVENAINRYFANKK